MNKETKNNFNLTNLIKTIEKESEEKSIILKDYKPKELKESNRKLSDLKRDNNGIIRLDDEPFLVLPKEETFNDNCFKVKLNNRLYLYLKGNRSKEENILELLIMYFIKELNMSCANYDIIKFKNEEFLASQSFLKGKEEIKHIIDEMPQIDEGYKVAKEYNNHIFFLKTCFIDRIIGNTDRFPCNYGIITNRKINKRTANYKNCPLFDNVGKEDIFIRDDKSLRFPYLTNRQDCACDKVINHLLDYEEIMHWISNIVRKANLEKAANRLFKEKRIYVDSEFYKKIEDFFKDSEAIINEELKNKGKSFQIKLT